MWTPSHGFNRLYAYILLSVWQYVQVQAGRSLESFTRCPAIYICIYISRCLFHGYLVEICGYSKAILTELGFYLLFILIRSICSFVRTVTLRTMQRNITKLVPPRQPKTRFTTRAVISNRSFAKLRLLDHGSYFAAIDAFRKTGYLIGT